MSYLILNAQLELLRRNLEEVERAVDAFDEGRQGLQDLLEAPSQRARATLQEVVATLRELRDAYDEGAEDEEVFDLIDEITNKVNAVRGELKSSMKEAEKLARRRPARLGDFRTTLNMELVDKLTKAKIEKLKALQADVQEAMEADEGNGGDASEEALEKARAAWEAYANEVVPGTPAVFAEYVEFLGGLALRYTGFDRGMCVIADELMSSTGRLPGFVWRSLTLPSVEDRLSLTQMIGLGFPEWTIWSLPLSVHALGEAWLKTDALARWAAKQARDEDAARRFQACVGDAVATHVLGPAYASALIVLRLNPFGAFDDPGRLALKRARIVLTTLERLNQREPEGFADEVIDELRRSWHEALRQAGQGEEIAAREESDGLTEEEVAEIDGWVEHITTKLGTSPAFRPERWASPILDLSAALGSGETAEVEIDLPEEEPANMLRDVLNAAWHCRLLGNPQRDLAEIDEDAKELWRRLEQATSGDRTARQRRAGRGRDRSSRRVPSR